MRPVRPEQELFRLAGSVADSLVTVIGNSGAGKTSIGTVTVTGTVSDTSFNVFNGNVSSVTVGVAGVIVKGVSGLLAVP